ncbi:hypothetical protein [Gemmatimonas sp.]|uniref:hypothetical protein n=1 Tax=Gemmatimonas sp. TaxID=1962908 RepID=UPI003983C890
MYQTIWGLTTPWEVERVELREATQEVDVWGAGATWIPVSFVRYCVPECPSAAGALCDAWRDDRARAVG